MIYLLIVIFHNTQSMTTTQSHCMDGIRWHLCLTASLSFLSGVFGLWAEKKRTKRNFNDIQWRHGPSMMFPVGKWCVFFVPLCPGTQTCMETPQKTGIAVQCQESTRETVEMKGSNCSSKDFDMAHCMNMYEWSSCHTTTSTPWQAVTMENGIRKKNTKM